ncbi:MBL fold metallo-hydrolase [Candidatus Viadribacter manganicus]|nr:MBL fold metallo-hydrolase [Candidatus Viadribacter manganicus]
MLLPLLLIAQLASQSPVVPPIREVAPGVHVQQGGFEPERGPDGNTVIFDAPQGSVVVDTGRHAWHSDAILAYARERRRPIAGIVNTHWHLDHSSGNGRLKAAYPEARVYTTSAVDRVIAPGGFLVRNMDDARTMLAGGEISPVQREEVQIFLSTMAASDVLRPDVLIDRSQRMRIGGRRFDVRVTNGAVTDADVWLYDRRTRTAVIGDLVTFPAPFFETACPQRWREALDEVWATPFQTVIPGHGAPMTRAGFDAWRSAYGAFIDCVVSDAEASACARAWAEAMAPLNAGQPQGAGMATYYVD